LAILEPHYFYETNYPQSSLLLTTLGFEAFKDPYVPTAVHTCVSQTANSTDLADGPKTQDTLYPNSQSYSYHSQVSQQGRMERNIQAIRTMFQDIFTTHSSHLIIRKRFNHITHFSSHFTL